MFVQDLYSKNPLLTLGGTFTVLFIVSILLLAGTQPSIGQTVYTDDGSFIEEEATPEVVNAVYGKITDIRDGALEVDVEIGDMMVPFSFTYNSRTSFMQFAYADEEDLTGSETAITSDTLAVGDMVSVYTDEAPGSVPEQYAVKVVYVSQ